MRLAAGLTGFNKGLEMKYKVEPIVQKRTTGGRITPPAPCGAAVPVGWEIVEKNGSLYYVKEGSEHNEFTLRFLLDRRGL